MIDPLNDNPELVRNCAASISGFLMQQRIVHCDDRWFTVPEIAEALNLSPALTVAILAFKRVQNSDVVEMKDGAIRYIRGRPR